MIVTKYMVLIPINLLGIKTFQWMKADTRAEAEAIQNSAVVPEVSRGIETVIVPYKYDVSQP